MMLDACLMVHGSWLMAQGSWLMAKAHGSWPTVPGPAPGAQGQAGSGPDLGPALGSPGPGRAPLAMSHEPWP